MAKGWARGDRGLTGQLHVNTVVIGRLSVRRHLPSWRQHVTNIPSAISSRSGTGCNQTILAHY